MICFHAQQCIEKCLKAYLVFSGKHIEKTHNLSYLIYLCTQNDQEFEQFYAFADELSPYAVTVRYTDDWREISYDEAFNATRKAEEVLKFVNHKLYRTRISG